MLRSDDFFPGWRGVLFNPFYFARAGLLSAVEEMAPCLAGHLLDVGCGGKPYRRLFNVDAYVGLDMDSAQARQRGIADCFYDGRRFPFDSDSFDSILCTQVMEHVFTPDEFLAEIVRVLKPGGKLLLTVPFIWDEHEQPHDFARYSSFGLAAMLSRHGLRITRHQKLEADASVLFQLANAYLYKVLLPRSRFVSLPVTLAFVPLLNLSGLAARRLLPSNPDLFLDHAILAEKPS